MPPAMPVPAPGPRGLQPRDAQLRLRGLPPGGPHQGDAPLQAGQVGGLVIVDEPVPDGSDGGTYLRRADGGSLHQWEVACWPVVNGLEG